MEYTILRPATVIPGRTYPVAVILAEKRREMEIVRSMAGQLGRQGFYVIRYVLRRSTDNIRVADIESAVAAAGKREPINPKRILLVIGKNGLQTGQSFLDTFGDRCCGAIIIGSAPIRHRVDHWGVWSPDKKTWRIPLWISCGQDAAMAANQLVMWRRLAASAPPEANVTIDPRDVKKDETPTPGPAITKWLAAISGGRKPTPGPDGQAEQEKTRYAKHVADLLSAMGTAPPATPAQRVQKQQRPMRVSLSIPRGWERILQREKDYVADGNSYVQVYLAPRPQTRPLLAKVFAAKLPASGPAGMFDAYNQKLARKGFLQVVHRRWIARGITFEISSILWPSRGEWHRWLVVSGATAMSRTGVIVHVMDASDRPSVGIMASAVKCIVPSASSAWIGGSPAPKTR